MATAIMSFELHALDGPDRGRTFVFEERAVVLVGSDKLCGIRLADETAAARHCSIELTGSALRIVALCGETRVNGVSAKEAYLMGGEILRVGETAFAVRQKNSRETAPIQITSFGRLRGESEPMRALYVVAMTLAYERTPLVIHGERGTGKRLLAEELHNQGPWKEGPFIVVPRRAPVAPFVPLASGGTLFIEDATPDQANEVASAPPADVRVILASARPRDSFEGSFERVMIPALRDREGDVAVLARHFWSLVGGEGSLPDDFVARYEEHPWTGNCRELRIAVQARLQHGAEERVSDVIDLSALGCTSDDGPPDVLAEVVDGAVPFAQARHEVLAEFERRYVDRALEKAGHNVARAAKSSGIAHRYFQVLKARRKNA